MGIPKRPSEAATISSGSSARGSCDRSRRLTLLAKIAASPEGQSCYAQRLVTYAFERDLATEDACTVQTLAGKMAQNGYTIVNLITDLTQTQSFRLRAEELP